MMDFDGNYGLADGEVSTGVSSDDIWLNFVMSSAANLNLKNP